MESIHRRKKFNCGIQSNLSVEFCGMYPLFPQSDTVHMNFNKKQFSKMLINCTDNNIFMFNNEPYIYTITKLYIPCIELYRNHMFNNEPYKRTIYLCITKNKYG